MKKVKKAVTDTDGDVRYDRSTKPGISNLLEILAALTSATPQGAAEHYERYGDLKLAVAEAINDTFRPIQERYVTYMDDPAEMRRVMSIGADRASLVAAETYRRAANAVGLTN